MKYFKSTSESQKNIVSNTNYIIKLERYTKDLAQLDAKLNSYTCEPRTKDLFERRNSLKQQMERLQKSNQEIIKALRDRKDMVEQQFDRIKEQFDDFVHLQSELQEYYTVAHSH